MSLFHKTNGGTAGSGDASIMRSLCVTIAIVILYRLGSCLPVPGVPYTSMVDLVGTSSDTPLGSAMGLLNMFAGGSLRYISLFSLSIMPYITATIIMQLMTYASPSLHALQRQGEAGTNRINQYARYLTLGLSALNAIGYLFMFKSRGVTFTNVAAPEPMLDAMFVLSLVGGSILLMYMGEKITDTKLFQGASILIFVNVIASVPTAFYNSVVNTIDGWKTTIIVIAAILLMVPFLVLMEMGQRRIPITYARQQAVGTRFARQTTYLPLKAMAQGVVPIIFASAFTYVPVQIAVFFPGNAMLTNIANTISSGPVNWVVQAVLIVLFSFGYAYVAMRPDDISDNLAKSGAFISNPLVPQGQETALYIKRVLYRIIMPASVILAALAIVPNILLQNTGNVLLRSFGGTSLLIIIGVICQCIMSVDSQRTMGAYAGGNFKRRKRHAVFGEGVVTD